MYNKIIIIFVIKIMIISAENNKGSLTFVIDRTHSMRVDIKQVKNATKQIADIIFNKNISQVQNMVLVAFDDPNTEFLIDTTNIREFNKKLDSIKLLINPDCPEMSLKGTLLGLEKSRPESYVFVFTDDSPKEIVVLKNETILDEILRIAQKNGHQIVFVVSPHGVCRSRTFRADIQPYYKIAAATCGQVFMVNDKTEVKSVLDYIIETVSGSRSVITSRIIPANTLETIPFKIDPITEYAIISTSGKNVELHFNTSIEYDKVTWLSNAKAIKITKPGDYEVQVKGGGVTSILVFGRTDFMFNYGFSDFMPEYFNETSKIPPTEGQLYLSIEIIDNVGDVNITMAELKDTVSNDVQQIILKPSGEEGKFYLSEKFEPHRGIVILSIIGQTTSKNTIIRRSRTPIDMSRKVTGTQMSPNVVINQGVEFGVDSDGSIKLICTISAFPKPDVIWTNLNTGNVTIAEVFSQEPPYQFFSKLKIDHVIRNNTYTCKATNVKGNAKNSIKLFIKNKPHINDIEFPKDAILPLGKERKFMCKVDSYPIARVVWQKNNDILHDTEFIKISTDGDSLTITNMQPELEGNYSCVVNNDLEKKIYQFKVTFGFVTIENLSLSKSEVEVGDTVVISCEAAGTPIPTITWHLNEKTIENVGRFKILSNSLRFQVTLPDSGLYICNASNDIVSTMKTVELIVYEKPIMNISTSHEKRIPQDYSIDISCPIIGGHPTPEVTWVVNNLVSNYTNNVIIFDTVQKSNAGLYVCTARNKYGSATYEILLTVDYPPTFKSKTKLLHIKIGETATLPCEVDSSPNASVKWYTKESNLITDKEKYHIDKENTLSFTVTSSKENKFICKASNKYGKSSQDTILYIYGMVTPKISNTITLIRKQEELNVNITCGDISGRPAPTIRWFFNNMITSYTNAVITLPSVQRSDAGLYKCIATNECGSDSHEIQLTVDYPPEFKPNTKTLGIMIGETATIPCKVDSSPAAHIKWLTKGSKIITNTLTYHIDEQNTLSFTVTSPEDSGYYRCEATNEIGNASQATYVYSYEKPKISKTSNASNAFEGGSISVSCPIIGGNPYPTMTWYINNMLTNYTDEVISFSTTKVRRSDKGLYKCVAKNEYGTDSHEIFLIVEYPTKITMEIEPNTILKKGERLKIRCIVEGEPKPNVTLLFNNNEIKNDSHYILIEDEYSDLGWTIYTLRFKTYIYDNGKYTCKATNDRDEKKETQIITIYDPVDFSSLRHVKTKLDLMEEVDAKLECNPSGYPKPSVIWTFCSTMGLVDCTEYFDGETSSEGTLHLNNLSIKGSGYYVCTASNLYDSNKFVYQIEVGAETTIHESKKPLPESVSGDFYLVLPCNATGNPKPEIRWKRNSDFISIDNKIYSLNFDGSLVIIRPTNDINGKYVCNAKNKHDEDWVDSKPKTVKVLSAPTHVETAHPNSVHSLSDGESLDVPCPLLDSKTITPYDYMRWYKDGKHYADGELRLINVNYLNRGDYLCRISYWNKAESDTATVNIKITEGKLVFVNDETHSMIKITYNKIKLDCSVAGPYKITVKWTHNGKDIIVTKPIHIIDNTPKFYGFYQCIVQNKLGTITRKFIV